MLQKFALVPLEFENPILRESQSLEELHGHRLEDIYRFYSTGRLVLHKRVLNSRSNVMRTQTHFLSHNSAINFRATSVHKTFK